MISKKDKIQKIALTLKESDILMCSMEEERDESLKNIRFDGEEELLAQYYKKNLTSVYRIRNNAAALLLRNNCTCSVSEDNTKLYLHIDDRVCEFSIPTIKNILQGDFDKIFEKNRTENPNVIHLEISNQVNGVNPTDSGPVTESPIKSEESHKGISSEPKQADRKPAESAGPVNLRENIKSESITDFNRKEEKESINHDEDALFWEDVPEKSDSKLTVKPTIKKEVVEENVTPIETRVAENPLPAPKPIIETPLEPLTNKNYADSSVNKTRQPLPEKKDPIRSDTEIDDESFWDIDEDFFGSSKDVDTNFTSHKPSTTNKEKKEEIRDVHIGLIKNEKAPVKEELHTDYPLEDKENDVLFGKEEPLKWDDEDDFGLEEKEEETAPRQEETAPLHMNQNTKPVSQVMPAQPSKQEHILETEPKISDKTDEKKENTERFRFDRLTDNPEEASEEDMSTDPVFSSETVDMDPEDILKKLKDAKSSREQAEIEQQILSETNKDISSGTVFDMSTGRKQAGEIDVEREANKVGEIADGVISTSKKDTLADKKLELDLTSAGTSNRYAIQTESDYKRKRSAFLYDKCKLTINIYNDADEFIKAEEAELIIFPLKIPESGNSLVTDICAYLEADGESHIAAVSPGGKTTVAIKSEEYAVFVRGSWENGKFYTAISVIGVGTNVKAEITKDEIRPDNLMEAGIGHNVLYIDHITTVHIIPREETNNLYEGDYVDFIAVIVRDYGIDQDCETVYTNHDVEMKIKGERYKYNLIGKWDNEEFRLKLMAK